MRHHVEELSSHTAPMIVPDTMLRNPQTCACRLPATEHALSIWLTTGTSFALDQPGSLYNPARIIGRVGLWEPPSASIVTAKPLAAIAFGKCG